MSEKKNPAIDKEWVYYLLRGLLLSIICLAMTGCAYFNTVYNAKRYYKQGLNKEEASKGAGRPDFNLSLEKAVIVARDYPDSRWIDDAFYLIAMSYYRLGNYEKANIQFSGFLEHFPESPYVDEIQYRYALTLIELEQYSEGRLVLKKIFDDRPYGKKAYFAWAEAFKREEDWDGARDAFRAYLREFPSGELAHAARLHLAEIELAGGDTSSAIATYEKYLSRAVTSKENYERKLTLAELYYLKADYSAARKTLKKTKGRYSDIDQKSDLLAAKISLAVGDTNKAEKLLRDMPVGDSRGEAFYILASAYEVQGGYDLALVYFDSVTQTRSDYSALAKRKKSLLEARVSEPDSTDTTQIDPAKEQFLLAQTYLLSLGDVSRSLEEYRKVVETYPESEYAPKALYGIAWLRRYRLDDPDWHKDIDMLIEHYPDSPVTKEALEVFLSDDTSKGSGS
ncbi:tetratricopeptide repeat protein [candidate division WOR-3 bacterium]|nr:tetratricopeptide repeat protein [candidate division WOR-3 bacterium]